MVSHSPLPGDLWRSPPMEIPSFFERDQDEIAFNGKTYLDYFNLYPNLRFEPTLNHLRSIRDATVLASANDSDRWQIAVEFGGFDFLVDTHYHGTSTLFCAAKGVSDTTTMLAFLGCFIPTMRDGWR